MLKLIFSSKNGASVIVNSNRADLYSVGNLLSADKLRVPIDSTFKVTDIKTALLKENGKKSGRVVIQVENGWNWLIPTYVSWRVWYYLQIEKILGLAIVCQRNRKNNFKISYVPTFVPTILDSYLRTNFCVEFYEYGSKIDQR